MQKMFHPDNWFMRALARMWDLIALNFIFLICCIPTITIGPALTALHYVTLKMAVGDQSITVVNGFFTSFRQNFRQGVILGLIYIAAGGFLGYDLWLIWQNDVYEGSVLRILVPVAAVVYLMTLLYVFPLLSCFNNTIPGIIRSAFIISVTSFFHTFSMGLLIAACMALTVYTWTTIRYGIFAWVAFGFSGIAFANAFVLNRLFPKYSEEYAAQQKKIADSLLPPEE